MNGARAAGGGVAADIGAGEIQRLTNVMGQQGARLYLVGVRNAVDGHGDLHGPPWFDGTVCRQLW
jgi:hypothetical protein